MRAEELSHVNVVPIRLTGRHHDIEVVVDGAGKREERLAARDAEIPLMLPSGGGQRPDRRIIRNHYAKVNDGLGVQGRDRSAADMLGHVRDAGQRGIDEVTQLHEQVRPTWIVGHHHRRNMHVPMLPQR